MVSIRILHDEPIGAISPRLYGHFAEHIGRCCYDGLWVGVGSAIPNVDGFRTDVLEALRAMPTPLLRWPGGCYADHYHWRDGIGPAGTRPRRLGLSCGLEVEDDNGLGTHEFLRLCELIGAEPYLAGNMGSGSVQEMCDWLEYCNSSRSTSLTRERASNGQAAPWGVKLWGVGNENWGCGGCYDPESYGLEYRRYACMLQHVDPSVELVACGHNTEWNQRLALALRNHTGLVDHFSIHRYWINGGPGVDFTEEDYYRLIAEADETESFVKETRQILDEIDKDKKVGIALDEWGVWHPEARGWGPGALGNQCGDYTQAGTMRDAVAAAVALEGFHRQCNSLSLANLAQIVNVLHAPIQTDGEKMWLTPTYHLLRMHEPHIGATALRTVVEGADALPDGTSAVSATASVQAGKPAVTIVNRSYVQPCNVFLPFSSAHVSVLSADRVNAINSAFTMDSVFIGPSERQTIELPPHSVATAIAQ